MRYALSTMWGVNRYPRLGQFFLEAEKAGFEAFELNHGVDSSMFEGLDGRIISSIHEPCPADISELTLKHNDWLISSLDEERRKKGVLSVCRSIDLAVELGACAVVVHPGRVDIGIDYEPRLRELISAHSRESKEYSDFLSRNIEAREHAAGPNLEQTAKSIKELALYARERGIVLGLENRYHHYEIPSPEELGILLAQGPSDTLGFWYDVGHAQAMEILGFWLHLQWLDLYADRIVGVHFHDILGVDDHRIAGTGSIPWKQIAGRIPRSAIRTCEFRNTYSVEEISQGRKFLESLDI